MSWQGLTLARSGFMFPKRCFTEQQPHKMRHEGAEVLWPTDPAPHPPGLPPLVEFHSSAAKGLEKPAVKESASRNHSRPSLSPSLISILPPSHFPKLPPRHREQTSGWGKISRLS